jgi:predicted lipoprotein with Yx(FWY)xxD motif
VLQHKLVLITALAATAIAGCGSSDNSSSSTPAAAASSAYGAAAQTTAAAPSGTAAVVSAKQNKLGTLLAGKNGRTLYLFEADKGSRSTCLDACAKAWPPLTTDGAPTATKPAVAGDLGTIERPDGRTQVTYKGHPLYYFAKDKDDEDAYGQGADAFGAEWYVLAPSGNKIDSD